MSNKVDFTEPVRFKLTGTVPGRRGLVKAAGLLAAEIERLDRSEAASGPRTQS